MKTFLTYARNHKGITLVLMAFLLVLLLIFASLAVDISYMYLAKNQLQVAADAAALAGASKLTGEIDDKKSSYEQLPARQEAWKFACKNRATQRPVFLVTNNGGTSEIPNCDTLPSSGLNETDNTPTEDIVVGNWQSPTFYPANGKTDRSINAIKVTPRRTGETPGMPRVSLFFGKIFGLLVKGADWSKMSARASAIATLISNMAPLPLCEKICDSSNPIFQTPLTTVFNSDEQNVTPGRRYIINPSAAASTWPYIMTFTSYFEGPTSTGNVNEYINGKMPPPICKTGCVHTTQGALNTSECELRKKWYNSKSDHVVNGSTINGWKTMIPIFPSSPCPGAKGSGCIDDPGYQPGDPYFIVQFAEIIITDVIPRSTGCPDVPNSTADKNEPWSGIVLVGTGPAPVGGCLSPPCSTIQCGNCNDPSIKKKLYTMKLVK